MKHIIEEIAEEIEVTKTKVKKVSLELIENYLLEQLLKMPECVTGLAVVISPYPRREDFKMLEDCAFAIMELNKTGYEGSFLDEEYGAGYLPMIKDTENTTTPVEVGKFESCLVEDPDKQIEAFIEHEKSKYREHYEYKKILAKSGVEAAEEYSWKGISKVIDWAKKCLEFQLLSGSHGQMAVDIGNALDKISNNLVEVLSSNGISMKSSQGNWMTLPVIIVAYRDSRGIQRRDLEENVYNDLYE